MRALDLSHVIAGPLASFHLAQMGADVVKIESPQGGEVMRAQRGAGAATDTPDGFVALNAGKKSLAIDIRTGEGAGAVRQLAKTADVFIENFRPGVVAKYGLDYARGRIRDAFLPCSAAEMETELNAVGVPAARVRGLGEFLRETAGRYKPTLPVFDFEQDGRTVRTAGLGFHLAEEGGPSARAVPSLGADNDEILAKLEAEMARHPTAK